MTNEAMLKDAISKSGKKKSYLANKIGVSPTHFGKLIINKYEFIVVLCDGKRGNYGISRRFQKRCYH